MQFLGAQKTPPPPTVRTTQLMKYMWLLTCNLLSQPCESFVALFLDTRTQSHTSDFLTPEQVLRHYLGNVSKAAQAMDEAERAGRILLQYLLCTCRFWIHPRLRVNLLWNSQGSKRDPNLLEGDHKVYRLVIQDRLEESSPKRRRSVRGWYL